MKKIDAHQHFWRYRHTEFPWINDTMQVLRRDFLPSDLAPSLQAMGIDGTVCVQARTNHEENIYLLELADHNPFIRGVVGWADPCDRRLGAQLERLVVHPKLRGVRSIFLDEADDRFMLKNEFVRGIGLLENFKLTYDLLIFPRHLGVACELAERFPRQKFVIDHMALPPLKTKEIALWAAGLKQIASASGNVFCKVSGMATENNCKRWKVEDFIPYLDIVFESFGTKRAFLGSDWPVCTAAGTYEEIMNIPADYLTRFSYGEQTDIWGNNASSFYGI